MGSKFLTARLMKITILWDMMPCGPVNIYEHFGGAFYLHIPELSDQKQWQ
jgi:hypothetical protein